MKQCFFIGCLCIAISTTSWLSAQSSSDYFNTATFWAKVCRDTATGLLNLNAGDTSLIVATTRVSTTDTLRWMGEQSDLSRLKYFFCYSSQGLWKVRAVEDLNACIALVPVPNKDWVVYSEGMGKIFTNNLDRGMQMNAQYGVNVILFDYPSTHSQSKSLGNYKYAMRQAKASFMLYGGLLKILKSIRLQQEMGQGKLSLFFHSMGNNIIRELAWNELEDDVNGSVWVDNLVLNAACVPQKGHAKWLNNIAFANRKYVCYNPKDRSLKWARFASLKTQLGQQPNLPFAANTSYFDFNSICGDSHTNFLNLVNRPKIPESARELYNPLLHGIQTVRESIEK